MGGVILKTGSPAPLEEAGTVISVFFPDKARSLDGCLKHEHQNRIDHFPDKKLTTLMINNDHYY